MRGPAAGGANAGVAVGACGHAHLVGVQTFAQLGFQGQAGADQVQPVIHRSGVFRAAVADGFHHILAGLGDGHFGGFAVHDQHDGAEDLGMVGDDHEVQRPVDPGGVAQHRVLDRHALGAAVGQIQAGEGAEGEGVEGRCGVKVGVAPVEMGGAFPGSCRQGQGDESRGGQYAENRQ